MLLLNRPISRLPAKNRSFGLPYGAICFGFRGFGDLLKLDSPKGEGAKRERRSRLSRGLHTFPSPTWAEFLPLKKKQKNIGGQTVIET